MSKQKITVIFSPSVLSLIWVRLINRGKIYYIAGGFAFCRLWARRLEKLLHFIGIVPFSYHTGIGSFGNGHINSVYKLAGRLTEQLYTLKTDQKLVKMFNKHFNCSKLEHYWKRENYNEIRNIVMNCLAIVYNYSTKSAVYVPCNSMESFVLNKLRIHIGMQNLDVLCFQRPLYSGCYLALFFARMANKIVLSGVDLHSAMKPKEYKVATEAVRYMDEEKGFNMLEWWDRNRVDKKDIIIISRSSTEPGRVASFREAKNRGFHCAEVGKKRKIPANRIIDILKAHLLFPFQIAPYLVRSANMPLFVSFLMESFIWTQFFCYYKVNCIVLSTEGFEPGLVNRFDCATIQYSLSYLGNFENPVYKYIGNNHFIVWGEAQIWHSKKYFAVDRLYYTGCHALSYLNRGKRTAIMSKLPEMDVTKKNLIFFDNKLSQNGSNPEIIYFRFVEFILKCASKFEVNIFFRPKSLKPFDVKEINDRKRAQELKEGLEKANITILNDTKIDVMSVIGIADIVIYSMVGTPSMMALMAGIPTLCYYDYIDETPDPIMKHYLNDLIFDDQEMLIKRIQEILNGDESGLLKSEDKKKLNHYLDFNGLERLQATVADIIDRNQ